MSQEITRGSHPTSDRQETWDPGGATPMKEEGMSEIGGREG